MNKEQFAKIAIAIRAAYPNTTIMADNPSMDLWYQMLGDFDYMIAQNAVLEHISTNKFAPTIAEIREEYTKRMYPPVKSFDDAWGDVRRAMARYGRDEPLKAYAMLDDLTVSIVKNIGWYEICMSENPDAIRANFRMAYEEKAKEEQKRRQIPKFVEEQKQEMIEQNVKLPEIAIESKNEIEQKPEPIEPKSEEFFKELYQRVGLERRKTGGESIREDNGN